MSKKNHTHKKKPATKRLKDRMPFSSLRLWAFIIIFAAIGGYILWHSLAAPAAPTVYLSPASQTLAGSTIFSVQVRENSGSTAVNAVQANISYPTSLLSLVSVDLTGTAFGTTAQNTSGSGSITLGLGTSCSTTCATLIGDQLVATLNFRTLTSGGAATVAFTSGTALVSASTNQDILGSLTATGGGIYTVDATAPTVSLSAPTGGSFIKGTVSVTATASDNVGGSGLAKVEFYVDGSLRSTDTASPYSFSWDTTTATNASHSLTAKAYDNASPANTTTSAAVSITADNSAPTTPGSFRTTTTGLTSIALAWNASTDNNSVTGYRITRNGSTITTTGGSTLAYTNSGLSQATSYTYTIVALDAAGNASTVATLTASSQSPATGDVNGDGHVDITDLSIMLSHFGQAATAAQGDVNGDGRCDITDLSILLTHFGT